MKRKIIFGITGISLGALAGYLYYYYVGCAAGTCPISSKPLNSSLYGAFMGFLFINIFRRDEGSTEKNK